MFLKIKKLKRKKGMAAAIFEWEMKKMIKFNLIFVLHNYKNATNLF